MSEFWNGKKVLVTGGSGFVGSFVVENLLRRGAKVRVPTRNRQRAKRFLNAVWSDIEVIERDLSHADAADQVVQGQQIVMQLAAVVGGIEYNINHPASVFRENMLPFIQTLEACRKHQVERVLVTSSACVYPRLVTIPTPEEEGFKDQPEQTNESYGWAKRMQEYLGAAYHREYGLSVAIARPYNCYGPRDNFNPQSSHVIPALIRRIWKMKERPLKVWGSGNQSRSFLYVEDFAEGLIQVAEKYPQADALNLGRDEEITIRDLVTELSLIHQELTGEGFAFEFDLSRPEGQPRRHCDVRKAQSRIGFEAKTDFKQGLRATVEWYLSAGLPDD